MQRYRRSNRKSSDRITIQIHLRNAFGMINTDILIDSPLINTKQKLFFIDRIRKGIQSRHLTLASFEPACGTVNRILHIRSIRNT